MHTTHATSGHAPLPLQPPTEWHRNRLLDARAHLAEAAIEHMAHDLPGADQLWTQLGELEDTIRDLYPQVWALQNADWAVADAARLHTNELPQPDSCRICRCAQAQVLPRAS